MTKADILVSKVNDGSVTDAVKVGKSLAGQKPWFFVPDFGSGYLAFEPRYSDFGHWIPRFWT